jgi:hypothetical protein
MDAFSGTLGQRHLKFPGDHNLDMTRQNTQALSPLEQLATYHV